MFAPTLSYPGERLSGSGNSELNALFRNFEKALEEAAVALHLFELEYANLYNTLAKNSPHEPHPIPE